MISERGLFYEPVVVARKRDRTAYTVTSFFLYRPHVSLAPTLLAHLYINSPTRWHPRAPAWVQGNTGPSNHQASVHILFPVHISPLNPSSSLHWSSWLFSPLPSSGFNLSHSHVALSPPTLSPASRFCQHTALNTCHLTHPPSFYFFDFLSSLLFLNIFLTCGVVESHLDVASLLSCYSVGITE